MLQDSIALENEIAAQISDFEPLVNRQYPLLLKLCRKVTNDKDEATGIVHDAIRKSYKRGCQETFFPGRLRPKMLSCIQPPASSNAHTLRLIVADLSQQQRDLGFRSPVVPCL